MGTWAKITTSHALVIAIACGAIFAPQGAVFRSHNVPATAAGHNFTNLQRTNTAATCVTSAISCAVTVTATSAGSVMVIFVEYVANASKTINTITPTACTPAWSIPAGSAAYDNVLTGAGTAMAACLNSASGTTSITVTMLAAPDLGTWSVFALEYSTGGGAAPVVDDAQSAKQTTAVTSVPGLTPALTGTSELIVQCVSTAGSVPTAVSTYLNMTTAAGASGACAELRNTSLTTAPNWNFSVATGGAVSEIALK